MSYLHTTNSEFAWFPRKIQRGREEKERANLSEKGFGVLLAKAKQANRLGSIRIGDKHELIVRIANRIDGRAGQGLGDVVGAQCGGQGGLGLSLSQRSEGRRRKRETEMAIDSQRPVPG